MLKHRNLSLILVAFITLAALATLTSCGKRETQPEGPPPLPNGGESKTEVEAAKQAGEGKTIAVVPKGTAHSFWLGVKAGAEAAGEEFGCEIIWQGPEAETQVDRQIEIIENLITQQVDAIVMAACDAQALIPPLQKAIDAGITIVTIDSGIADDTLPVSFVATDNVAAAAKAAETLAGLLDENVENMVGIIPFDPNAQSSQDREKGFREELFNHPHAVAGPTLYCNSDVTKAVEKTENMLNAEPDLAAIFAANQPAGEGVAEVLRSRGLGGVIKVVAFDASEPEIAALRDGTIQALIVQNPWAMGHDGVECAIKHLAGQPVEKRVETDVIVVTADNIDDPEVQKVLNPAGQ